MVAIGKGGVIAGGALLLAAAAIGYRLSDDTDAPAAAEIPGDPLGVLERTANESPEDAGAWQRLGLAYFDAGRFADAATAYARASEIDPENAMLWSSQGEALVMASERDPMPAEALAAFQKAIALDSTDPRARYFLAVDKDLSGDHQGAIDAWLGLLAIRPLVRHGRPT